MNDVVGCVTSERRVARGARPGGPLQATFQRGVAVLTTRTGARPIRFRIAYRYSIDQDESVPSSWRVALAEWVHTIDDVHDVPIVAFHWHPVQGGRVTWSHLHVYGAHGSLDLHKLRLPTGTVSLAAVVRFPIEDLGVLPRRPA